jgi:hypothetical protein
MTDSLSWRSWPFWLHSTCEARHCEKRVHYLYLLASGWWRRGGLGFDEPRTPLVRPPYVSRGRRFQGNLDSLKRGPAQPASNSLLPCRPRILGFVVSTIHSSRFPFLVADLTGRKVWIGFRAFLVLGSLVRELFARPFRTHDFTYQFFRKRGCARSRRNGFDVSLNRALKRRCSLHQHGARHVALQAASSRRADVALRILTYS